MSNELKEIFVQLTKQGDKKAWTRILFELQEAGWQLEHIPDGIIVGEDLSSGKRLKVRILDSDHPQGTAPQGFAILEALGATQIERVLCERIPRGILVDKVVVGFNWSLVRAGSYCGIARSPERGTQGARTIRPKNGFQGIELADLAAYLKSTDPLSRSVGLAAVNAFWNRSDVDYEHRVSAGGLSSLEPPGEGVVIVGGFRGAARRLPMAKIVEREPKKGDISSQKAVTVMGRAKVLAITAQALMNGSLGLVLKASESVPHRMLVGPSAPLCPLLFKCGLDEISAAIIKNPDAAEAFILETGTMIMLDHITETAYLRRKP